MFPLFWLLRNLGGLARWGGSWEEAREEWGWQSLGRGGGGEVRAKPPPQLPTEPEIPAERRRERHRKRHTHRETASYTQPERGGGAHAGGCSPAPRTGSGPESVLQARPRSLLCPRLSARAPLCAASTPQPPDLVLLPTEFEEGLLDRCPAPGPHPALVEGRRNSVKVEAEASRQ